MMKKITKCEVKDCHQDVISHSLSQEDIDVLVNRLLGFIDAFEEMA